jgi:AcrR family transcriptional regulator
VSRRARPAPPAPDARARILDAAVRELVERGLAAASTNTIARRARVAKGLVFHYFPSKDELVSAAYEHVAVPLADAMLAVPAPWPRDLFERLHAFTLHKLRVFQHDPLAYQLVTMIAHDAPPAVRARVDAQLAAVRARAWPRFLEGVDASRLRRGISLADALDTLALLGEGVERRVLSRLAALPDRGTSQLDAIGREVWVHFARLRDGLYAPAPRRR